MIQQKIIKKIAQELNLTEDIIETTYKAYWKGIKEMIEELPLKEVKELSDIPRVNINIPSLGKLSCTSERFNKLRK